MNVNSLLGFKLEDVLAGMGFLIFVYLVFANWRGANALLTTGAGASISMVRTLQGR